MLFKDTQEAITFGKSASATEVLMLDKSRKIYHSRFEHLMSKDAKTLDDLNQLQILATREQFCNEALKAVGT